MLIRAPSAFFVDSLSLDEFLLGLAGSLLPLS